MIADVLGPVGSPAAFLFVAVDLLISHWPATRGLLVPFVGNPELLAVERQRSIYDQTMGRRLVTLGVSQAHEFETRVAADRPSTS